MLHKICGMGNGVYLYGAGGHCKVVIDIAETLGVEIAAIVDDNPQTSSFYGYPVLTGMDEFDEAIVTIGNCAVRERIVANLKVRNFRTLIHPSAIFSNHSAIGAGCVVMQGAIVQASTTIGNHSIVNTKSSVGHDCIIGDFVHIASGCTICGGTKIGDGSWIGAGTTIIQGIKIGRNCFIGAGSVVVKDIPDNCKAYGVPCRVVATL